MIDIIDYYPFSLQFKSDYDENKITETTINKVFVTR